MASGGGSSRRVVNGYVFGRMLGSGAFGQVWRATKGGDVAYAVKVVSKVSLVGPKDRERFQREIDTMAVLRHPNICQLHDFFQDDEFFYLVEDLCAGVSLTDHLAHVKKMPEAHGAYLFLQLLDALAYCHENGVAHRDLKPDNVLFDEFPHLKIIDFGLCGYFDGQRLSETFCGSPFYTAPECLNREAYDGTRADVWSLGTIAYQLMAGRPIWKGTNTASVIRQIFSCDYSFPAGVSEDGVRLVKEVLQLDPALRPTVKAMMQHPWVRRASPPPVPQAMPRRSSYTGLAGLAREPSEEARARVGHGVVVVDIASPFEQSDEPREVHSARGGDPGFSQSLRRRGSNALAVVVREGAAET